MNVKTRQRLIGFLLLLLLAAILAPLVLRSPDQVRVALDRSIPKPPETRTPDVTPVVGDDERRGAGQRIDDDRQTVVDAGEQAVKEQGEHSDTDSTASGVGHSDNSAATGASDTQKQAPDNGPSAQPKAGFTVQVASFSDESNARDLVKRLKDADYNAYYRSVEQGGNTWQRVFVGPEIERDNAEALKRKLADDKRFALEPGLVRPFTP